VAKITMIGDFTTPDFLPGNDGMGHLVIFDPRVVEQKGNAPAVVAAETVLEVKAPDSGEVTFAGPTGTLWLDHPGTFTGKVTDFSAQEGIDLPGVAFGAHTTLGYVQNKSDTGGALTVKNGTEVAKGRLARQLHRHEFRRHCRRPRRHPDHREPANGGLPSAAAGQAALNGAAVLARRVPGNRRGPWHMGNPRSRRRRGLSLTGHCLERMRRPRIVRSVSSLAFEAVFLEGQ
jgi:hypothetical protein